MSESETERGKTGRQKTHRDRERGGQTSYEENKKTGESERQGIWSSKA